MTGHAGFDASEDISRAEYAYSRLIGMLRSGELRAGQRLREVDLAEWLGVSRTPVREALRRISSEGLVEILPGRGLVVASYDKQQVRELYALRGMLEGAAAHFAARHASEAELGMMREMLERSIALFALPEETMRLNAQFHSAMHEAAHNRYLQAALAKMTDALALLPGTTFAEPGRAAAAHAEHLAILDAVSRHQAEEAETLARRHIDMAGAARLRMMFSGVNPGS